MLESLEISFYELLLQKMNDRKGIVEPVCSSGTTKLYNAINLTLWVHSQNRNCMPVSCGGTFQRLIVCVILLENTFGKSLEWKDMVQVGRLLGVNGSCVGWSIYSTTSVFKEKNWTCKITLYLCNDVPQAVKAANSWFPRWKNNLLLSSMNEMMSCGC